MVQNAMVHIKLDHKMYIMYKYYTDASSACVITALSENLNRLLEEAVLFYFSL